MVPVQPAEGRTVSRHRHDAEIHDKDRLVRSLQEENRTMNDELRRLQGLPRQTPPQAHAAPPAYVTLQVPDEVLMEVDNLAISSTPRRHHASQSLTDPGYGSANTTVQASPDAYATPRAEVPRSSSRPTSSAAGPPDPSRPGALPLPNTATTLPRRDQSQLTPTHGRRDESRQDHYATFRTVMQELPRRTETPEASAIQLPWTATPEQARANSPQPGRVLLAPLSDPTRATIGFLHGIPTSPVSPAAPISVDGWFPTETDPAALVPAETLDLHGEQPWDGPPDDRLLDEEDLPSGGQ
jgi:hypothetical protein